MKISQRVSELLSGHLIMTDRQTDRRTDGWRDSRKDKVISIGPPLTSSGGALINDTEKDSVKYPNTFTQLRSY